MPLNVSSKDKLLGVLSAVDKANGFCFAGSGSNMKSLASSAVGGSQFEYARTADIRENMKPSEKDGDELWNDLDKVDINPGFQV